MNIKDKKIPRPIFGFFLVLLILGGIFLRLENLDRQSYWMDEGYTVNAVNATLQKGLPRLHSGEIYQCYTYCYPTALMVKMFGNHPGSFRFLAAMAGVALAIFIFVIAQKHFNRRVALLSLFFSLFSYWQVAWSRQARWYTLLALFFWLSLFYFREFYETKSLKSFLLTVLFAILSAITHPLAYFLIVIFLGWPIIDRFMEKKSGHQATKFVHKKYWLLILIIFMVWLTIEIMTASSFFLTNLKNFSLHYKLPYYLNFYLRNYWLFCFFAILAVFSIKKPQKKEIVYWLWPIMVYLPLLSFFTATVHYRYLFHLTPALLILAAVGIDHVLRLITSKTVKITFLAGIAAAFFLSGQGLYWPKSFYALESDSPRRFNRPYYAYTPQPDFNAAYTQIKTIIRKDEIIISSHPQFNEIFLGSPGYWLKYDYWGINDNLKNFKNDQEYYVGAKIIDNFEEFLNIINKHHGYVVFDYMAKNRIEPSIIDFVKNKQMLIFSQKTNEHSIIWVYKF